MMGVLERDMCGHWVDGGRCKRASARSAAKLLVDHTQPHLDNPIGGGGGATYHCGTSSGGGSNSAQ